MENKISLVFLINCMLVFAEPPRFNQHNFPARQQQQPGQYPPSGWRPQGASFTLPARQQQANNFAFPARQYGAPDNAPESTTPSGLEFGVEHIRSEKLRQKPDSEDTNKSAKQVESVFKNTDRGLYYVYLPDGRLQRVVYTTSADLQNMAYTARVQYQDVDPVSAPIFSAVNSNPAVVPIASVPAASQQLILQPFV